MHRRTYLLSLLAVGVTAGCTSRPPSSTPTRAPSDPGAGSTPTGTPTPRPTESPTSDPTTSPTATPEASLGAIDEPRLEAAVLAAVREARETSVVHEGSLAEKLDAMAASHSDQMARARTVAHVIDGETIDDRYEAHDLSCRFRDDEGDSLLRHEDLEVVGAVSTRGVTAEEAADELVGRWLQDEETGTTLLLLNADHIGIGVTIVTGRAYVTIVYC